MLEVVVRKSVARTTRFALTALAVTALAAAPLAGTAAAAPENPCPHSGALCLWDQENYQGPNRFNVKALDPNKGTCVNLAEHGWPNGRAKSGWNNNTRTASLFASADCTGRPYPLSPGGAPTISFPSNSVYVY